MALIQNNGTYLKITSVRTDIYTANFDIYQNEAARDRELAGQWTEFDIKKDGSFNTAVIQELVLPAPFIPNSTLEDTFKTLCYVAMLCDFSAFGGATLDQETVDFIASLTGQNRIDFETSVDYIIDNRPELTQEDRDLIKSKLFN